MVTMQHPATFQKRYKTVVLYRFWNVAGCWLKFVDFLHAGSAAYITSFQVDDMFSCFETDHRCDRQTDRRDVNRVKWLLKQSLVHIMFWHSHWPSQADWLEHRPITFLLCIMPEFQLRLCLISCSAPMPSSQISATTTWMSTGRGLHTLKKCSFLQIRVTNCWRRLLSYTSCTGQFGLFVVSWACLWSVGLVCSQLGLFMVSLACLWSVWLVCGQLGLFVVSWACLWSVWLVCSQLGLFMVSLACLWSVWLVCGQFGLFVVSLACL